MLLDTKSSGDPKKTKSKVIKVPGVFGPRMNSRYAEMENIRKCTVENMKLKEGDMVTEGSEKQGKGFGSFFTNSLELRLHFEGQNIMEKYS